MIIDGEKWACEACVRGHRVSNCQHSERPLQHINKKGRPVSQCQHCRSMRKSRASHVKCDCGEKTHKCAHLHPPLEGHRETCCCNHGGRCTCCHKKDPQQLDTVPESDSDRESHPTSCHKTTATAKSALRRRRAHTTHSEGVLSLDEHGHHKPTYRHAKASSKCGPYSLSRGNSMHSTGSLPNQSADNLSTDDASRVDAIAIQQRKVKSEAASPSFGANRTIQTGQLPPLDLSAIDSYPAMIANSFDLFGTYSEADQCLYSAGLSAASVDWSHYDLEFNTNKAADNFAPSNYSQPQSFSAFDFNGSEQAPTLTTATSGEVSEVEDFIGMVDDFDVTAGFGRTSTTSTGFDLSAAQANLLGNADFNLDYEDLKLVKPDPDFLPTPPSLAGDDSAMNQLSGAFYSFVENDPSLVWAQPGLNESPDPNAIPFWDTTQ